MFADRIDVNSNFAVIMDVVIKTVHCKSITNQRCSCHYLSQGKRYVIIRTNFVGFEFLVLHTQIHRHLPFGPAEETFKGFAEPGC